MKKFMQAYANLIIWAIFFVWGFILLSPVNGVMYNILGYIAIPVSILGIAETVRDI